MANTKAPAKGERRSKRIQEAVSRRQLVLSFS